MNHTPGHDGFPLVARAPLRVSFAGGGTDLPAYYERFGGFVVSTTIDRYVYAQVSPNGTHGKDGAQITSADYQAFYHHHSIAPIPVSGELALPKAVLHTLGVRRGISLFIASEVPPGTGLGSSSAAAVAMVGAVSTFLGNRLTPQEVAETACHVELEKLGAPIGKQDQFAAAFGGLNAITFSVAGVSVAPLRLPPATQEGLGRRLMLFFTGTARNSTTILKNQQRATTLDQAPTVERLHRIKEAAYACKACLERGDLDMLGTLLDEGWRQKRNLVTGITDPRLDGIYYTAMRTGALGGKITGAGGGGFLLLYCHEHKQEAVTAAMENLGLRRMEFHLEPHGMAVSALNWTTAPYAPSVRSTATA